MVRARAHVPLHHIVGVDSCMKSGSRHAHAMRQQPGGNVSKIPAGHDELDGFAGLHCRPSVVNGLWDPATDVDGVGTSQGSARLHFPVQKCLLNQALAIVKSPLDFDRPNIRSDRGELLLLDVANASAGIQNDNVNPRDVAEPLSNSRTRIARSGNQHRQALRRRCPEQARHDPGTDILECGCRPVKQFQLAHVFMHLNQGDFKVQRIFHQIEKAGLRYGFPYVRKEHPGGQFRQGASNKAGPL